MSVLRWTVPAILAIPVVDSAIGWATMSHSRKLAIDVYDADSDGQHICIAFPGFSNPPTPFGKGMRRVLDGLGPLLVVRHCNKIVFEDIYQALMNELSELKAGEDGDDEREIIIYGHSKGGQLGTLFQERYERDGSPFGKIKLLLLDCSPGSAKTLRTGLSPTMLKMIIRLLRFYWGGPLGALLVVLANLNARRRMPVSLDETADAALYEQYARELMWYNNRAVIAQLKFMFGFTVPTEPSDTTARVVYIGAKEPELDALVNQPAAVREWQQRFPHLEYSQHAFVGHAWPMEQPQGYGSFVGQLIREAA